MCGRYDFNLTAQDLSALFGELDGPDPPPNRDLAPGALGLVIARGRGGVLKKVVMRWGLEPGWMTEPPVKPVFNARAETVSQKPMFREAFRKRRCLVPADAFFEWTGATGRKTRWRLSAADGAPLVFAGIWELRKQGEQTILTYAVVTVEPNAEAAEVHDRMPAVLPKTAQDIWLDPDADAEALKSLLRPAPDGFLTVEKI